MFAKERTIFLADCQSCYASVEKATHPGLENLSVVVAGDSTRAQVLFWRHAQSLKALELVQISGLVKRSNCVQTLS